MSIGAVGVLISLDVVVVVLKSLRDALAAFHSSSVLRLETLPRGELL